MKKNRINKKNSKRVASEAKKKYRSPVVAIKVPDRFDINGVDYSVSEISIETMVKRREKNIAEYRSFVG